MKLIPNYKVAKKFNAATAHNPLCIGSYSTSKSMFLTEYDSLKLGPLIWSLWRAQYS